MKQQMFFTLGAMLLGFSAVHAAPLLTIAPATGAVAGTPGSIVGWGFSLTPDANYSLSAVSSFLEDETNSGLGGWNDVISFQGGPDGGVLLPTSADWMEDFSYDPDPANQTGLGWFQIGADAVAGQSDSGVIHVDFELDSVSPDCPGCFVATESVELPFTVSVTSTAAPEPGTLAMILGALGVTAGWRKARKR